MHQSGVSVVLGLLCLQSLATAQPTSSVSFSRQVGPLLEDKCGACHSPDSRTSGLEITSVASLLKGGKKNGAAVIPGKPANSPIIQYTRGLREPRMPRGMQPLSDVEIRLIEAWIEAGAPDDSTAAPTESAKPLPASEKLLNDALFSANSEELLILRRGVRLKYVARPADPPRVDASYSNPIDQFILAKWKATGLKEYKHRPELASDADFLRRVYLDVIGVIPTIAEAQRFLADRSPDKRDKLIDELLARNSDYAAHWTPFWEEAIASSDTGVVGGIVRHGDYRRWIYNSFLKNRPYDVMVAELIDPTMPGYQQPKPQKQNGEYFVYPQFVLNSSHNETIQTAANTAQVFLGTGMKCASCHDHFLNKEWPQKRFLAFASLFSPHDLEVIRCEQKSGKFVGSKFPFDLPDAPATTPTDINSRLHRVAVLLTDPTDSRFAQTIVNRLWKRYLGLGLIEPADDYRTDRAPSHPEMIEWLAYDFMQHGYDLKHTIRLILTSRTYQFKYDPALEDHFDIAKPKQPRYYRSPALRKLTAEQLIDSLRVATTQALDPKARLYLQRKSTDLTRALGRPAARNEVSTARPEDVAVVQALELLNGEEFHDMVYSAPILKENPTMERLYWAAFDRAPSDRERELLSNTDAPGDVLWAMFVSPAFEYIH
jgi:mono/diheme cytochrome c family protein